MWRSHFATMLHDLGLLSSLADPDVWLQPATMTDGFGYYEYILVYVDDLLVISHRAGQIHETFKTKYRYVLKDVGPSQHYLSATIGKYDCNGLQTWYMSAEKYLENALHYIKERHGTSKQYKIDTPLLANYHPKLDTSPFLRDGDIELYQSYIGVLCWVAELGVINLTHSVSLMAHFSACPHEDQFSRIIMIFQFPWDEASTCDDSAVQVTISKPFFVIFIIFDLL